ncbi:MAG TPA: diguanylate cyclase, partial [Thermoanaerobaculia bacterium]|nr:diguanylate cyclase [Thermoanaerobaculia bacterium]
MAENDPTDAKELAQLVKRLERHRRARQATDAISESATRALYENQQHLRLLQAVAIAANESSSLDDALLSAVDQICAQLGWPVGHAYLAITEILALSDIWFVADLQRFAAIRETIETTLLAPGAGAAAKAIACRAPVWSADLDSLMPPPVAAAVAGAGLKSVLAVPVIGDEGAVAALEFFIESDAQPEAMLVEVIGKLGDLLGKVHIRTKSEATLRSSEEQYRLLFEGNPNPMWIYDSDSLRFIAVNDAAVQQYGYSRDDFLKMTLAELQLPGKPSHLRAQNGLTHEVEITAYELKLPGRRARLAMAVDINAARRTEDALRESERRFREMLDTIELFAVLLDVVGTVTYCNPYLLRITGYAKQEVVGKNFFELFVPAERRDQVAREFLEDLGRGIIGAHIEMEIGTRSGERRVVLWNNTVLRSPESSVFGVASIGSDVTEQRQAETQLVHNAFHDALTGLPNRALFLDRVEHALEGVRQDPRRGGRKPFAVLLLDIDHFKDVNDSLGHAAGDELLIALGQRIGRCMRTADTVARFGGDEFTILMESITGPADVTRATKRIHDEIAAPFTIEGQEIFTSASIGVTIAGPDYETPEQVVRDADTAMYRAKAQGRGRSELFDLQMREEAVARLQIENDLRRGLERSELRLVYQPIVNLATRDIVGFEALVRWQHPKRGM